LAEITEGDDGNDSDSEVENSNFEQDEETDWVREVEQTIQRAFDEAHSVDIATLELNTLKMAMNITFKDLRQVVIPSILLLIPVNATRQNVYDIVSRWFPIVKRFTHSESDQVDCLHVIVQFLLRTPPLVDKTPFVIQKLYEIDLIEEDAILEWVETVKDAAGQLKKIKDAAQPFVDWLNDAETDSEEDSD
jgi:translation initiation factor eIF-2B subunit epsilon